MGGLRGVLFFAAALAFATSMVLAVVIDARSRRFPNVLAAFMAFDAVILTGSLYPNARFLVHLLLSAAVFALLFVFELAWRRVHKREGMGMGDAKAISILVLISPIAAFVAFCISMVLLALVCALRRADSLPLLPLLMPAFSMLVACVPSVWARLDGAAWI